MATTLTLNQTIKQLTDYGNQHAQINFVYFGEVYNRLSQEDVTYPAMFITLESSNILAKQIEFRFSLYFMDRQLQETEGQEVLSDMTQVCGDIVAQIRNQANIWDAPDTIALEYFTESDPDYLAGVRADVTLTLPLINDRCQVPIK